MHEQVAVAQRARRVLAALLRSGMVCAKGNVGLRIGWLSENLDLLGLELCVCAFSWIEQEIGPRMLARIAKHDRSETRGCRSR